MRFVHQPHYNFAFFSIIRGQLLPQACELIVCGSTLTNDVPVPAGIVVYINNTVSTGVKASLDESVIFSEGLLIEGPTALVVDQVLPSNRQPEGIEAVVVHEMFHLSCAIFAVVLLKWWHHFAQVACSLMLMIS